MIYEIFMFGAGGINDSHSYFKDVSHVGGLFIGDMCFLYAFVHKLKMKEA